MDMDKFLDDANWRAGYWRTVFPNEKRELSAGCTEDRRAGCRNRQPSGLPFSAVQLNVQLAGPP